MSFLDTIRFDFDPVLTRFAMSYKPQGLVSHRIFPRMPVAGMSAKIPVFGPDALAYVNTKRALRAEPVEVSEGRSYVRAALEPYALQEKVDPLEIAAGREVGIDEERRALFAVQYRMALAREFDIWNRLNVLSWGSNKLSIAIGQEWDQTGVDPYPDIVAGIDQIRTTTGMKPNVLVLGYEAWKALRDNQAILDRINTVHAGAGPIKQVRPELVAALFELDEVVVAGAQIYNGTEFENIWVDDALLIVRGTNPEEGRPVFGWTAAQQFGTLPDEDGGQIPLYGVAGSDVVSRWAVSVWYQEVRAEIITNANAGFYITNCSSAV